MDKETYDEIYNKLIDIGLHVHQKEYDNRWNWELFGYICKTGVDMKTMIKINKLANKYGYYIIICPHDKLNVYISFTKIGL